MCLSVVAERVAAAVARRTRAAAHRGCGQLGPDRDSTHETLAAYCGHPNVGAVLVIALGCEQVVAQHLADAARRAGKPAQVVAIQSEGGTVRTTARAIEMAKAMVADLERAPRETCDISELILCVKCGGSDYTSGLASNPALGRVADRLVDLGGAAVLGEIAEIMGAEHAAARAPNPDSEAPHPRHQPRRDRRHLAGPRHPRHAAAPGNIRGGLTTIEEKSLGAQGRDGARRWPTSWATPPITRKASRSWTRPGSTSRR